MLDYSRNVNSQSGEDGILEKVLELLPELDGWCVEFGAWDGVFLSNTRHLIDSKAYSSVMVEANTKRFNTLKAEYGGCDKTHLINAFVGFDVQDSLDVLLADTPIPQNFDLLSVDIDGNDYHVWKAVSVYQPKVVCIEYNPTIPTEISFVQQANPKVQQGCSLLALVELGKAKGYELVSVTPFNAIFVKQEYFPLFGIECNDPAVLRVDTKRVTYIFVGYDGHVFLRGRRRMPWHGAELRESRMQALPFFLKRPFHSYNLLQKVAYGVLMVVRQPGVVWGALRHGMVKGRGADLE